MKEGGKAPKAVRVSGEGLGAWDPVPAPAPVSDWFYSPTTCGRKWLSNRLSTTGWPWNEASCRATYYGPIWVRSHARILEIFVNKIWMKAGNGNWLYGCRSSADPRLLTIPSTSHISSSTPYFPSPFLLKLTWVEKRAVWIDHKHEATSADSNTFFIVRLVRVGVAYVSDMSYITAQLTTLHGLIYKAAATTLNAVWSSELVVTHMILHSMKGMERTGQDRTGQDRISKYVVLEKRNRRYIGLQHSISQSHCIGEE